MTPQEARLRTDRMYYLAQRLFDYKPVRLFEVEDRQIDGRSCKIPIRIYKPEQSESLPVIVYFHGGGFVLRSIETHDRVCRRLARDNRSIVVSVGYRLAPEHKYPAAVHDAYDATEWVAQHAESFGADPERLVVMGDSAGGNLAGAVALMARNNQGPKILQQVLLYPCTDGRFVMPSTQQFGKGFILTKELMEWFYSQYAPDGMDMGNTYSALLLNENLQGLPPAIILTAQYDPLRDEGYAYAEKLKSAGVPVTYLESKGLVHGFMNLPKLSKRVLKAYQFIREELNQVYDSQSLEHLAPASHDS
ncbi:alpha/beta hydrolase [Pontibacter sp. G13]|uniref:alpha/beta hydrolase n=1 Tax=Pontibacter sp. G13 TaxID=3074898 RepID=UPI00288A95C4|nr:alpha/beta hydrolase [Pontibacter sp. G13]WNJ18649.1 alpha/beta hydrolase [Pontibacter sp. G13]